MKFADKLIILRKKAGYSQEQLAGMLNVSRQSVSKWEADTAMPELTKLIMISDIFRVSVDCLVREERELEGETVQDEKCCGRDEMNGENGEISAKLDEITDMIRGPKGYTYVSSRKIKGIPLVHVNINPGSWVRLGGRSLARPGVAKGIIAVGDYSIGVVSVGCISAGIFSLGVISFGLISLGMVSIGLISGGVTSMGLISAGDFLYWSDEILGIAALKLGK